MKKRILIILTSLSLLLFNGCDAILDAVYPPEPNNIISIELEVDSYISYETDYITIAIIPMKDGSINTSNITTFDIWRYSNINYSFEQLDSNAFRVFAFQDTNYDGLPNWDEPSTELINSSNYSEPGLFDFRYTDDDTTYEATGYLGDYPGIDYYWLKEINSIVGSENYVDVNYTITGPTSLPTTGAGTQTFTINRNNIVDTTINSIEATFVDSYGQEVEMTSYRDNLTDDFKVNFDSTYTTFYGGQTLTIKFVVTTTYNGNTVDVKKTFTISFYDVNTGFDPSFTIAGTTTMSKSSDYNSEKYYNVILPPAGTLNYLEWKITDSYGNAVNYDGYSGFNYNYSQEFLIEYSLLSPLLNNAWWTDSYFKIIINVYYTSGDYYQNTLYVYLTY